MTYSRMETLDRSLGMNRALPPEYAPGTPAPASGTYEQRNVLGSPTGLRVTMSEGEELPVAPRGFTWARVEPKGSA